MPGLKVTWRSGVAWATGSVAGERIRKSLGTRDAGQADELCALYEARLWKRRSYGEEAVRTFEEAALSYMEAGGDGTYLAPIITRFRGRLLGSIKPEEIRQAARELKPDAKGSTRNRHVVVPARAVINHAADGLGWCAAIKVKGFPVHKARRVSVDRSWIDAFLDQADADDLPHLAACVLFMWQNGVRVSEAARVLPAHLNLKARVITMERTKADEWETRHISRELVIRVANLPMEEGVPLFGYTSRFGIRNRMMAVCRRAGITFVPPHQAGRHSFATEAFADGATVPEVMEAGGYKTARLLLENYAHAPKAGVKIAARHDTKRTR